MDRKYRVSRGLIALIFTLTLLIGGGLGVAFHGGGDALAGAEIIGDSHSAHRLLITSNGSSKVSRIVYFNTGTKTNPGANTPVVSGSACGSAVSGTYHYAEVRLVGTLAGTNPTLTIKLQNSYDNGTTWVDAKTFTAYNATSVPAVQTQVAVDHGENALWNGTTVAVTPPVVYGDCWRVTYTYGGTSASGSFSVIGIDK